MASTSTFQYAVRDRAGKLVSGKLEGESQAAVVTKLKSMGYAPVSITQTGGGMKRDFVLPKLGAKVKLKDLSIMSRQFATMINSGLSLLRALSILAEQTENKDLAKVLAMVRGDVETGQSLSSSFAKHPMIFPPLMINMCRAGEVGGFLDRVLLQIAENYEAEVKLRGKIKSAMTYPTVVFIIAIIAVIGMLLFIVPVFTKMFLELEIQTDGIDLLQDLGELMRKENDAGQDKRNDLYNKVIALSGRSSTLKSLVDSLKVLVALEREAFGLDDAQKGSAADVMADFLTELSARGSRLPMGGRP